MAITGPQGFKTLNDRQSYILRKFRKSQKNPAEPNYHMSIKKSQAILKCFIDLKSSVWFTLGSGFENLEFSRYRSYSHSEYSHCEKTPVHRIDLIELG